MGCQGMFFFLPFPLSCLFLFFFLLLCQGREGQGLGTRPWTSNGPGSRLTIKHNRLLREMRKSARIGSEDTQ